jgi:hypothetical protein
MKLEFKFSNDVIASINLGSKVVTAWVEDRYGEVCGYRSIPYDNDNEMVDALKDVSEMVNMDQHEDICEAIFNHFKDANILYNSDGTLDILAKCSDELYSLTSDEFEALLESLGAEYSFEDYHPEDWFIKVNGKRIASITFKY